MKTKSTFFGSAVRDSLARNIAASPSAEAEKQRLVSEAQPWATLPLEALWSRVFGATINRSWMVWSDGHCPDCLKPVVMYEWKFDAINTPWKMACPHCQSAFPKNDFKAYYESGLDQAKIFDHAKANRSLLFNTSHPNPADPLHLHGVDDGTDFKRGEHTWRFVGAYLVYGEWKQFILGGIRSLAAAYLVTGDLAYSRRAAVLLDRVADVFPDFDYIKQGLVYEKPLSNGYVSVWHDANFEQAEIVVAYDQIFDAIADDEELIAFLSSKARECGLANGKNTAADIQKNISDRLLADPLANPHKIHSNFPALHTLMALTRAVLYWEEPGARSSIYEYWTSILKRATAVDGVTGEKGLQSYTHITIRWLAKSISIFLLADPDFIVNMIKRVPTFARTFRFHIDTWCADEKYYPCEGDGSWFGAPGPEYLGLHGLATARTGKVSLASYYDAKPGSHINIKKPGAQPSMDRLLWEVYRATGDVDFLRLLVHENTGQTENAVFDLTLADNGKITQDLQAILAKEGQKLKISHCVNLEQWHLAILRSGSPGKQRAVWVDYDSGGLHAHQDGLNMGLIAKGLDLMPDAGYPPVQFGGWETDKAKWYYQSAAHNTVVVDGQTQPTRGYGRLIPGFTKIWTQTPTIKVIEVSAPAIYGVKRYDRTLLLIDISDDDFYVVDLFHVLGGRDHAKFIHSTYSTMETLGLKLETAPDFGHGTLLRNFQGDSNPTPGWSATWKARDLFDVLPEKRDIRLKYTDLTLGAQAFAHEGWFVAGQFSSTDEIWLPRMMVRRQGEGDLASTFVGVFEPYESKSNIASIKRLDTTSDPGRNGAAIQITLVDGRRDIVLIRHQGMADWGAQMEGQISLTRHDKEGRVERAAMSRSYKVQTPEFEIQCEPYNNGLEIVLDHADLKNVKARTVSSDLCDNFGIQKLQFKGQDLLDRLLR